MSDKDYELSDLLTREGHLTELTLNRLVAGELSAGQQTYVEEHADACAECEARRGAVSQFDSAASFSPSAAVLAAAEAGDAADRGSGAVVDLGEARSKRRGGMLGAAGLVLAAAAALFLVVNLSQKPEPTITPNETIDDGIRLKGAGLSLEVYAKGDGEKPRAVGNGDVVRPGDRLGFRITSREDGYMMIVGADDSGEMYPVYPAGSRRAKFLAGEQTSRELEAAIRLDDAGRHERLVLARCPAAFEIRDLGPFFKGAPDAVQRPSEDRMTDCVYDDVVLTKKPR